MKRVVLVLCTLSLAGLAAGCSTRKAPAPVLEPTLILVSLDGFRWDYMDLVETPNLHRLAAAGVRAEGLIPVFPSRTFPSHYSIATGLYPGHHGMINHDMYDKELDVEFHRRDRESMEDPRWWGGEPIWVTAEKQGLAAATMFWPGSETEIRGVRPSDWRRYDKSVRFEDRVAQVLAWLDRPAAERPRMITLYMEEPNDTAHDAGPEAAEAFAAVREVDARIGDLLAGLEDRGILDQVNLVVVSDHGMAEVGPERVVVLDDYVDLAHGEVFSQGALLQIFPDDGREAAIYDGLKGAHPHLRVYRPDEIPERYRLRGSPRVPPITGVPDVGWEVYTRARFEELGEDMMRGDHGQDPADPSMHGLFVAAGPSFRRGLSIGRFECVEIYNLMAEVLGLEPAPNDGDPETILHILSSPD